MKKLKNKKANKDPRRLPKSGYNEKNPKNKKETQLGKKTRMRNTA